MYKTLKELLTLDANGRRTLLNALEPLNAEPTNRGTRAIATSVDKLLAANTANYSLRVTSANSSFSWDNTTTTLSIAGTLVLQCAFPVSGDEIEVFPYSIELDGDFSVLGYRVLILPEVPDTVTVTDSSATLLNFSSIAELISGITSLTGAEQSRAVLIAAKHTTSAWLAPGVFIADGSTITNFGTDSQYAIQEDFLELEDHVFERDHVSFYETAGTSFLSLARLSTAYTVTNNNSYSLTAIFKSNRQLNITIPSPIVIQAGQILYATYAPMVDDTVYSTTATVGTWEDAGSAETYITLLSVPSAGGVVFSPIGNNHITIATGRSGVPFTLCGRINPNSITYETAAQTVIRNNTFGSSIPASPHTTASFPRLVKSGGSAQSAYTDTGVEAHTVVCGDLITYGAPTSDPLGISLAPYPPSGATYKIVKISPANGTGTPGIETKFIFVDGNIWADNIFLGETAGSRIRVREYITSTQDDLETAEGAIDALELRMDTAESGIDILQTEMLAAEANITQLQSDVETAQDVAEFARNTAHAARYFGSAMDVTYSGDVPFGYNSPALSPVFRRPRPYLSARVGSAISVLTAGAVRGLASDGIRVFILDVYSSTTRRLRSVSLDESASPNWVDSISRTGMPVLTSRAFIECSGGDVYLMSGDNNYAYRYSRTISNPLLESDTVDRSASIAFLYNCAVICNKNYLSWGFHPSTNFLSVLRLGDSSEVHNPANFSTGASVLNTGFSGLPLTACSFGKICMVLFQRAPDYEPEIMQVRLSDAGIATFGDPQVIYGYQASDTASGTDGEYFFVGTEYNSGNLLTLTVVNVAQEVGDPNFNIVYQVDLTDTLYPGIQNIRQLFADGSTLYLVCSNVVYAFKYNGAPSSLTFCWKYNLTSGTVNCAVLTWAGLILGLTGSPSGLSNQNTIIWLRTDTYGKELIEFEANEPSADWLYRKPFRQLRTFMS